MTLTAGPTVIAGQTLTAVTDAVAPGVDREAGPIDRLWVAGAHADRVAVGEREEIASYFRSFAARQGLLVIHTCHRVEVVGSSADPSAALAAAPGLARMRRKQGMDAVRHVLRVATGLESAVMGEDQILGQLRVAFAAATTATDDALPSDVRRLGEMALAAGREARSGTVAGSRDLARPALQWLVDRGVALAGSDIMVVGAGTLGERLAEAAHSRGARVLVASRDPGHATAVAQRHGGGAVDLAAAAELSPRMDGIAVALGGPWLELRDHAGLPPMVDLSAPPAVPSEVRRAMGARFGDVDQLYPARGEGSTAVDGPQAAAYAARAEQVVETWAGRYGRWLCGRGAVPTLCSLRDRSEERRQAAVERLLRRLPELDERQQELIGAFSRQLTATLLHEPSTRLREDEDGSAARAARTLFDLPR